MDKQYWLVKSEPNDFSLDDLKKKGKKGEHWDGVRNYQARNNMQKMKKGDEVFFYHSFQTHSLHNMTIYCRIVHSLNMFI